MKKSIDVRGLACPQPVLETKKVLENEEFDVLEIIADNETAKENLSSLLKKMNFQILSISRKDDNFHILVAGNEKQIHNEVKIDKPKLEGKILLFTADTLGKGNEELGKMLIKAFTHTLTELNKKPKTMIFMNSGVKLCVENAETIANLKKLQAENVQLLVCGTCLNFYNLTDKLKVGEISNMYDISELLSSNSLVVTI
jgi:selenium metabolism protein YedF